MFTKFNASAHARQTKWRLKIAHHKHTGQVLPKASTSYPMIAMILLIVGVLLVSWTSLASGDFPGPVTNSYTVNVSVPGPPPSQPATIDGPTSGQVFSSLPITVNGSCPSNTYEELLDNGVFSGVMLCSQDNTYSIQTGLFVGQNQLTVQDKSLTDVPGPISNSITVTYSPPSPPINLGSNTLSSSNQAQNSSSSNAALEPLLFKTDFSFKGYYAGQATQWNLDIEGGQAPYAISVDWGDGTHGLISRSSSGNFTLTHIYNKPGKGYKGSYTISLSASDANNNQAYLQLVTIVNNPPSAIGSSQNNNKLTPEAVSSSTAPLKKYVWASYAVITLMAASFWLGELQVSSKFRPRLKKHKHS